MTERARPPATAEQLAAYAARHTTPASETLASTAASTRAWSERVEMMIDEPVGQLLRMLAGLCRARRVLEIGTFGGYSALAMVEGLPADGHIDTLELDPDHAVKAREHIEAAGESARITVHEGIALDTLEQLSGPYDLAFIDADKSAYAEYYELVLPMMRRGGLMVADNVVRHGRILDTATADPSVVSVREFNDRAVSDPRVDVVMLTMRDGISLIRVRD